MRELTVSFSRLQLWKTNHYDHYMRYIEHLTPAASNTALDRGTMIHALLEAYSNQRSWGLEWEERAREYNATLLGYEDDVPSLALELMENWVEYYQEEESHKESLGAELEFKLPLCKGIDHEGKQTQIYLKGFIDWVYEEEGDVFIRDYKTYSRIPSYEFFLYNYQSAIYQWALTQGIGDIKKLPKGMEWDIIKATMPAKPRVLKSGELSMAKLSSTPYTIRKGIIELGLNPKDYTEFIEQHKYSDFFQRHLVRYNKKQIAFLIDDIKETAKQLCRYQYKFKDFNLDTKYFSSYRSIWQAEAMGIDTAFVKQSQYIKKEDKDAKEEKEKKRNKKKSR